MAAQQFDHGAAAADLDVVAVRADEHEAPAGDLPAG
jgi:hypothetical protein